MKNLLRFIINNHSFLLFVLIESFTISLTIKNSDIKKEATISSANFISGFFYERLSKYKNYFNLTEENIKLQKENSELRNKLQTENFEEFKLVNDSISGRKYLYKTAEVIKNSVFKNNFLTINKGSKDGIHKEMVVVSSEGIVGIISNVSRNYSTAISLLNTKLGISGRLKKNNHFGSVVWDAKDYRYTTFNEIPNHIQISIGDTVVTSGYSALFPPDIPIGTVAQVTRKGKDNFLDIQIKLSVDFKTLRYVYLIENLKRKEQIDLESITNEMY